MAFLYIAVARKGGENYNMKKYISLLFVTVLFLSACSSSKQFHQVPSVSFKLPKSAKQIAFEDFYKTYDKKKSEMRHGIVNLYQIDSFYIGTKPVIEREFAPDELNTLKKGFYHMHTSGENIISNTTYESTIKTYNKRDVLIESFGGDWYQAPYFRFNIITPARTQMLIGILQFPKTEKAKATALLDKLLTSIRFEPTDNSKNGF